MSSPYKKAISYFFCNVAKLIKIQSDELVSFHSISYLSVVSSDKADLTKIMSP